MCRLFGVLSQEPVNAAYLVKDAPQSLLVQSHFDKKRKQGDGWGIGWLESGEPRIYKGAQPIYRDLPKVRKAIRQAAGNVLLGHVRWASNPLKLPRHELIGVMHSQPFSHGPWLFVHNGTLLIPKEVVAALGPWKKYIKGKNDSEVLFYWLLKTVIHGQGRGWPGRLRASFRALDKIWQGCKKRYPIYRDPYHGLNWVLTNGRLFLAFCYVNPRGFDKGKALCHRGQPYYQLQIRETDRDVTVASEPLEQQEGWRSLGHGRLLVAEKRGSRIRTKIQKVMK